MENYKNIPDRAAGVLLPVSSLYSPYGIGSFGDAAREWIDFLARAGQSYWQVLPIGPTSYGDSPYQSFSAFAGNPYFIDLDTLCKQGLLRKSEYAYLNWGSNPAKVDYAAIYKNREAVLRMAYARFKGKTALESFCAKNPWVQEYALYMSIKATMGHKSWIEWDAPLRDRQPGALEKCKANLAQDIEYHIFVQHLFFEQWNAIREYAAAAGVQIIGDIPIYVAMDSADVWAGKEMFQLGPEGLPTEISGCPPDAFSADGQLWGNPLYNWQAMKQDGYSWWVKRMQASFELYDVLRIDHFRGIESYCAIPYGEPTAQNHRWRQGPGIDFVNAMNKAVPQARIIAEDLGYLTDDVRKLLKDSGYPGMKVLQFAFDSREENDYSPYNYDVNFIVYTGTHDNDTTAGWAYSAPEADVEYAMEYLGIQNRRQVAGAFVRLAMQTRAVLSVIPMQDWLELGSETRMNTPSTIGGSNWRWRLAANQLNTALASGMQRMARIYGRLPGRGREKPQK